MLPLVSQLSIALIPPPQQSITLILPSPPSSFSTPRSTMLTSLLHQFLCQALCLWTSTFCSLPSINCWLHRQSVDDHLSIGILIALIDSTATCLEPLVFQQTLPVNQQVQQTLPFQPQQTTSSAHFVRSAT